MSIGQYFCGNTDTKSAKPSVKIKNSLISVEILNMVWNVV